MKAEHSGVLIQLLASGIKMTAVLTLTNTNSQQFNQVKRLTRILHYHTVLFNQNRRERKEALYQCLEKLKAADDKYLQ